MVDRRWSARCVVARAGLKEVVRLCVQRSHRKLEVGADDFCATKSARRSSDSRVGDTEREGCRRDGRRWEVDGENARGHCGVLPCRR